jgi:hypothetical protein
MARWRERPRLGFVLVAAAFSLAGVGCAGPGLDPPDGNDKSGGHVGAGPMVGSGGASMNGDSGKGGSAPSGTGGKTGQASGSGGRSAGGTGGQGTANGTGGSAAQDGGVMHDDDDAGLAD